METHLEFKCNSSKFTGYKEQLLFTRLPRGRGRNVMKSSLNYMISFGEAGEERKMGERKEEDSNIPVSPC